MTFLRIYVLPSTVMLVQTCGLALALIADGRWEWLATALIAAPVLILAAFVLRGFRQNFMSKSVDQTRLGLS